MQYLNVKRDVMFAYASAKRFRSWSWVENPDGSVDVEAEVWPEYLEAWTNECY